MHNRTGPPCFDSRVLVLNGLRSQLAAKFRWKVSFFGKLLENNQVSSTMSTGNATAGSAFSESLLIIKPGLKLELDE